MTVPKYLSGKSTIKSITGCHREYVNHDNIVGIKMGSF